MHIGGKAENHSQHALCCHSECSTDHTHTYFASILVPKPEANLRRQPPEHDRFTKSLEPLGRSEYSYLLKVRRALIYNGQQILYLSVRIRVYCGFLQGMVIEINASRSVFRSHPRWLVAQSVWPRGPKQIVFITLLFEFSTG